MRKNDSRLLKKSLLRFYFTMALLIIGYTAEAATTYGTNLVVNGDASKANLSDWTTTNGPSFVSDLSTNLNGLVRTGNTDGYVFDYYTGGSGISSEYISQTIDISDISTTVAIGHVTAILSGSVYRKFATDVSRIVVDQLDASNNVLATSQFENDGKNVWQSKNITVNNLNTLASKLKVTLYGTLSGITTSDGSSYVEFDQIDLELFIGPLVTSSAATSITSSGATLNDSVNAHDYNTAVTFEYGLTTAYGLTVTADQSPLTGSFAKSVSKAITGLASNTTYHYRVVGVNSEGTTYGSDQTFTTTLSTGLTDVSANALSLSPNPATNGFTIHTGEKLTDVSIYNLSGSLLLTQQVTEKTFINISSLQPGVYIVKANGLVSKLVKN